MKDEYAVIVAGGIGTRMGSSLPKQFMLLHSRPILMKTIELFKGRKIILVLPKEHLEAWDDLCARHSFETPHRIVVGGATRSESVLNGLNAIPSEEGIVAIHDGVRPLVKKEVIEAAYSQAALHGSAVPCISVFETVREVCGDESHNLDRNNLRIIQTPQTFDLKLIREAYSKAGERVFTDDASVYESLGLKVNLIEGNRENIKITVPEDLKNASIFDTD